MFLIGEVHAAWPSSFANRMQDGVRPERMDCVSPKKWASDGYNLEMGCRNLRDHILPHHRNEFAGSRDCFRGGVSLSFNSRRLTLVSAVPRNRTFSPMCNRRSLVGIDYRPSRSSIAKVTPPRYCLLWRIHTPSSRLRPGAACLGSLAKPTGFVTEV